MTCKVVCLLPTTSHICHEEHSSRYCLSMSPSHHLRAKHSISLTYARTLFNTSSRFGCLCSLGISSSLPSRAADKQCACEHSKGAIYDLCKTRFTSRVGGITAIYHCVVIHSAFELGGYGGKVTIYLRNDKGNGENFLKEVGVGKC